MDSLACSYSARFDAPGALFFVPPCDSFPPKCARSRGRSTKWRSCRYLSSSTLPLAVASRQLRPLFVRKFARVGSGARAGPGIRLYGNTELTVFAGHDSSFREGDAETQSRDGATGCP